MVRKAILLLASLAAQAFGLEAPIPGYGVEDLVWEVKAFANGTKVNITGTIQDVHRELFKINPDYPRNDITGFEFAATDNPVPNCPDVGVNQWGVASTDRIIDGIAYLRSVTTQPSWGPGPGNCGRVSCSWNSAIWACNEHTTEFTLPNFGLVADCAQLIVNFCSFSDNNFDQHYVLGELSYPDQWSCNVRSSAC